jgi:serine protease DegS
MGSGVVVDASGLILTVNYVVMGAQTVEVAFAKGRRVKAEVVAQDFEIGVAVVRVKKQGLTVATLGADVTLERGDPVIALASTAPQERRVSGGVVTYLGEFEAYWEYLLDRGIVSSANNPGFGGGGLFSMSGAMVGVLSLNLNEIARSSLAIPIDFYQTHERELLRYGRVMSRPRRAWLGVFAHALDEGVVVAGIVPDGPGDKGGLQEGDVIMSLNAEEVGSRKDLYLSLWRHEPGERLTLEVMRDNKLRRLEVTSGDRADFFRQP